MAPACWGMFGDIQSILYHGYKRKLLQQVVPEKNLGVIRKKGKSMYLSDIYWECHPAETRENFNVVTCWEKT